MSLDIKKSCSFQILISLTTVVWPSTVMLCFGLMLHPPPIYQSRSQYCCSIRVASSALVTTAAATNVWDKKKCWILQPIRGGGEGDTPLYRNLKLIAVLVLEKSYIQLL